MNADGSTTWSATALTGRSRAHVVQCDTPRFAAHPEAAAAFLEMRAAAAADGFDLRPFSSFRDFRTQLKIWNRKFQGLRPIFDAAGRAMDAGALAEEARVWAILGWSALPGGSRHHWGTEIDVVDGAAVDAGRRVELLPWETAPGGPFHALHEWLDAHIARFGFFRPYDAPRGGMHPEPWHLSFWPAAAPALAAFDEPTLRAALAQIGEELAGAETVGRLLPEIIERHVRNIGAPPNVAAGEP